jgi:hypothetical protein
MNLRSEELEQAHTSNGRLVQRNMALRYGTLQDIVGEAILSLVITIALFGRDIFTFTLNGITIA